MSEFASLLQKFSKFEACPRFTSCHLYFSLYFQVYWFIVEFGLCREGGRLKAIGAGLLSAYGELQHACSDTPDHKDFEPTITAVQKYEDDDYQPLYFVANSIQDALIKLRSVGRNFLCFGESS